MSAEPQASDRLRALPQIQRLLETDAAERLAAAFSRTALVDALRAVLDEVRGELRAGAEADCGAESLLGRAEARLAAADRPVLRRVINATGVVVHTNFGRSPLPEAAVQAMAAAGQGYSNLEFDLATGQRGRRGHGVEALLTEITGAEDALAVNNAAAAVLLALSGIAAGGEVIVSRGELVEIGGGFRIPEVIAQGGARLVEVGTTNKTRLEDYRRAVTERTRVLLKVHQSNYRVVGFTAECGLEDLSGLARERGLVLMQDLGSGSLVDLAALGRPPEPTPQAGLRAGADLVAFSGDKLMGGPQAGLLVGKAEMVGPLKRHPLMRALRPDKVTLAGLEATLRLYRSPERAVAEIPTLRMLAQDPDTLAARASRLAGELPASLAAAIEPSTAQVGGGSLPGEALASWSVTLRAPDGDLTGLAARLRLGEPSAVGRLANGRLVLDLFTVADEEVEDLAAAVAQAAGG